jgi:cytochrome c oxidase subunit II
MKPKSTILGAALLAAMAITPSALVSRALNATGNASRGTPQQPRVIQITARQFEFSPNQVTIKKGETVKIELTSADVKHGFYIRGLKVDELIEPGKTTDVLLAPQTAGTYPTICDHLCGSGHGNMKMTVVVED